MIVEQSVQAQIREWLRPYAAHEDMLDLNELVPLMAEDLSRNGDFARQFIEECLYPYATQAARLLIGQGRQHNVIEAGGVVQTREGFEEEAKSKTFDYSTWFVHASQAYLRLTKMNRYDLLQAIEDEKPRIRTERIRLRFKSKLAAALPEDPAIKVEDVLTNGEIAEIEAEATQEIDSERDD